ncbi:MAG: hypothetical protein DIU71_09970 [Proteobacteria bacterium]|nr:MAG: hypothetical protein DIU71_09970 [Pseudomonadota bacterium]
MRTGEPAWLLYGASGYTGELIAREAVRRGMRPVLAGRSRTRIERLAAELDCPCAVFALEDHTAMLDALQGMTAVLHCAGPFSATAPPMMQACLAARVHYLDITGEIDVFELARGADDRAQRAGIVLCPGVGFDVVPTDCVALKLKEALPDATHLALGFESRAGRSVGTAKTAVESLGLGCRVRREGHIVRLPLGALTRRIDFGAGERMAVAIPWGDVSTAYYTTGIGNIEVYVAASPRTIRRMRCMNWARPLLRQPWLVRALQRRIERTVKPPDRTQREANETLVWGEVRNAGGRLVRARLRTADGYQLTVSASLALLAEVIRGTHPPGFATPARLVGADFVTTLPGSSAIRLDTP